MTVSAAVRRLFFQDVQEDDVADQDRRRREVEAEAAFNGAAENARKARASWDRRPTGTTTIRRAIDTADGEIRELLGEQ